MARKHDILALHDDASLVLEKCPDDTALGLLERAIDKSIVGCSRDARQFPGRLIGHLMSYTATESDIHKLLQSVHAFNHIHEWWYPITPTMPQANDALRYVLNGHTGYVTSVCFSPDGSQIISGSDDKTVILWNAHTSKMISSFTNNWSGFGIEASDFFHFYVQCNSQVPCDAGLAMYYGLNACVVWHGNKVHIYKKSYPMSCGFMTKEGVTTGYMWKEGGIFKTWNTRWFELRSGILTYYTSSDMKSKKGSYDLSKCRIQPNEMETKSIAGVVAGAGDTVTDSASDTELILHVDEGRRSLFKMRALSKKEADLWRYQLEEWCY